MSGISNYLANKIADWELRGQAFTPPATVYVALLLCSKGALARSTAYSVGDTVSNIDADGYNHLYACTTAGTTAATAPSYPGNPAEVITDGTAVFTEQDDVLAAAGCCIQGPMNTDATAVSGASYEITGEAQTTNSLRRLVCKLIVPVSAS